MVRINTLALFALSFSATVLARPTHKRRGVCNTVAATTATAAFGAVTPAAAANTSSVSGMKKSKTKSLHSATATISAYASANTTSTDDGSSSSSGNSTSGGVLSGTSASVLSLFPVGGVSAGWSVAAVSAVANTQDLVLSADTFVVEKQASTSSWPIVSFEGKTTMLAHMAKGSLTPGTQPAGGFSFYTPGPQGSSVDLTKGKELTFSYSIYFDQDYDFNIGGKLPGLYGGTDPDIAATCSGGEHDPRCFSARLMWRTSGMGELYLYLPPGLGDNDNKCGVNANSACTTSYGSSVGRGTWTWKTGVWQTVSQRIKLNDAGSANGEAEIFIDGESVLSVTGLSWRSDETAVVQGAQMQIFFGGHTAEWASPKDQDVHFADFSAAIIN